MTRLHFAKRYELVYGRAAIPARNTEVAFIFREEFGLPIDDFYADVFEFDKNKFEDAINAKRKEYEYKCDDDYPFISYLTYGDVLDFFDEVIRCTHGDLIRFELW